MTNLIYNKEPLEIDESTGIPVFQFQDENVNEFSIKMRLKFMIML